jgi:hypothetical protein
MWTNMNRLSVRVVGLAGGLLLQAVSSALGDVNPYLSIVERNAFALRPPPPPPEVIHPPKKETPTKVYLTGITLLGGQKKAWFVVSDPKAPNDPNRAKNVSLKEGQQSGDLEVLQIFEKTGAVNVMHEGQEMMLNFKNNFNKSVAISIPGAAPGPALVLPGRPPVPSGVPTPPVAGQPGIPARTRFGMRPTGAGLNPGMAAGQYQPVPAPGYAPGGYVPPIGVIPGATASLPVPPPVQQDPAVAVANAIQNLENANRANAAMTARGQSVPQLPPLPPIPEN